ncbi:hypothetical protein, partial [Stenotrophomonas maltophilia group sp. RNC7]|uniref:hypothetical protein n=1 Tax=Stenotrophomonas maltophilia group sp. RNC7 TaxID=3071467 RepID=UPI0027E02C2F
MIYKIDLGNDKSIEIFIEGNMATMKFQNQTLFSDSLMEGLGVFKTMLKKALNNELEIDSKIKNDSIG